VIGCEIAAEDHVHQAGLALRVNLRHTGKRRRQLAGARDDAQAAGPFGHQHAAVGQEGERPGMHQPPAIVSTASSPAEEGKICGAAQAARIGSSKASNKMNRMPVSIDPASTMRDRGGGPTVRIGIAGVIRVVRV